MRLPTLFIGHGSPMNALADNDFTRSLHGLRASCGEPKAILVVSAHWTTEGTWVTHMPKPRTIHDFYGFPQKLFDVRYTAPGDPHIAELIRKTIPEVQLDDEQWGFDHGTWSVLRHLFPEAEIPVLQLSLNITQPPEWHLALGRKLSALREQGVLIVGSGNVVHNLRKIRWEEDAEPFPWATQFDAWVREKILAGDGEALARGMQATEEARLSVPTVEHYLPLLYVVGAAHEQEKPRFVFEGLQNASISMRSWIYGT